MHQEIDKHLAKAIIDITIFLEFSDETVLDADASVGAMEQLAAELQLMSQDTKNSLIEQFQSLASEYPAGRGDFVRSLAETMGLV